MGKARHAARVLAVFLMFAVGGWILTGNDSAVLIGLLAGYLEVRHEQEK